MATTQKVSPEQILDALAAHPGVTSAELAEVLGIGQSTAAKHLATLESAGTARREPGGREGGRRLADRWSTTAPAPDDTAPDDAVPEVTGDSTADDGAGGEPARSADRLGRGALGALVREYLVARPGEDLGPTQIGKALGRSQGAVSNALARLEAGGEAQLVTASPRRYRIVESR
jgi:DNA-binding MarR family transcriptional regulator